MVVVLGLVNIFTITRHVRAEEQSGRMEFLRRPFRPGGPCGRRWGDAVSALLFVVVASALMVAVGLPLQGSVMFAAAGAACGWVSPESPR